MDFSDAINIITGILGVLCCLNGYLIWKKQIMIFQSINRYARVKPEDMDAYCKEIGISNILIGIGVVFIGIYNQYFESSLGVLIYVLILAVGCYIGIKAQIKYNGSML